MCESPILVVFILLTLINLILSNFHLPAWPDEAYLPNALTLRFNVECYQLKLKCDSQESDTTVAVVLLS